MNSVLSWAQRNLSAVVLLLFAALSLVIVIDARDPIGLLGWLFSVAVILTAGQPAPCADPEI